MLLGNRGEIPPFLAIGLVLLVVGGGLFMYGQSAAKEEQEALENAVEIGVEILETDIRTRERANSDRETPTDDDDVGEQQEIAYQPTVGFTCEYEGEEYRSSNSIPAVERSTSTTNNRQRRAICRGTLKERLRPGTSIPTTPVKRS